jgi:multicomponent Na+:H+ antiporter subunit D
MNESTFFIPGFVVIPLAGAFINSLLGRRMRGLGDFLGSLVTLLLFGLSLAALHAVSTNVPLTYHVGGWRAPIGIVMVIDGLTAFMLVTVNTVAFAVAIYARDYMARYTAKEMFYTLLLLMVAGMNGVIVAGDLFNLFVFLEVAAFASYALVAFGTGRHELEAAFKYAVMGTIGSLIILLGIALLYAMTSTLNMADMSRTLAAQRDHNLILMVSTLFLTGFGLKAALVPFHAWLPDAHPSAPAPISAMLSGVLIKSLGIYSLTRIFFHIIGMTPQMSSILMFLGVLSMVVGAVLAIGQRDLKRLLAYSSISQIGYVVFAIGLATPLGILGGLFHLVNHSLFKALLFLNSGAVEYATGTRDLRMLGGLSKQMPVTATTNVIASLSIAGIPPFSGFWSKLLIIMAAVQAGQLGYAFIAVLVSVLTLAMVLKVMKEAFGGALNPRWQAVTETPRYMQVAMVSLSVLCILSGALVAPGVKEAFLSPAADALMAGTNSIAVALKDGSP